MTRLVHQLSERNCIHFSDNGDHENVASIMAETNTLIQLPDRSVGGTTPDPFAQQVTITGYFGDVDRARMLMRVRSTLII